MNARQCMRLFSLAAIFLFLMAPHTCAIGIGPSRVVLDFEPNMEQALGYQVLNNGDSILYVEMYARGDLAEYITLHETYAKLDPRTSKGFTYDLKLPSFLEPGTHDIRIGALESSANIAGEGDGTAIGARAGVEQQLWIKVPFPGKYVRASLTAPDVSIGHSIDFTIDMESYGTEDVTVFCGIEIFDADNNSVVSLDAGDTFLESKQNAQLTAHWEGTIKAGTYRAVATMEYGGEVSTAEKYFHVGEMKVKILSVETEGPVVPDAINKINVTVQSMWNEKIYGVYVEITVKKGSTTLSSFRSETIDLKRWDTKTLDLFWGTQGVSEGEYQAEAVVHYADKTAEYPFTLDVVSSAPLMLIGLGLLIFVLLIIVTFMFLKIRKKDDNSEKQQPPSAPMAGGDYGLNSSAGDPVPNQRYHYYQNDRDAPESG